MFTPHTFNDPIEPLARRMPEAFRGMGRKRAVLGVGALTHDNSAALVCAETGNVLHATIEERLSNVKHDSRFPIGSILQCCRYAVQNGFRIESVAVNFIPELYLPSVIEEELAKWGIHDEGRAVFIAGLHQLAERGQTLDLEAPSPCRSHVERLVAALQLPGEARYDLSVRVSWYLNVAIKYRNLSRTMMQLFEGVSLRFVAHHDAHAASAFLGSGMQHAAILVIDGHGEVDTTTLYRGEAGLVRTAQSAWPHSLGSVYLAATRYLGFEQGDEYKVMGMAAYGTARYLDDFRQSVKVTPDGVVHVEEARCFGVRAVRNSGQIRFSILEPFRSRCTPRAPGEPITQEHFDFAASVQALIEELGVKLAEAACRLAGTSRLAIAGGVGLNGLMNEAIRRAGAVTDLFIYPAASDDGTSAGAAQLVVIESGVLPSQRMQSCYFGYSAAEGEIEAALRASGASYSKPASIHDSIAQAVAEGKIVARCTGGAEFGPRALGHRSILANPAIADMKDVLNIRVKHREQFRPFAPACLREHVEEFFELSTDAPFMILVVRARERAKSIIPAVVHNDGSARVQTVTAQHHPDFHRTLQAFHRITGIPVMINTSFNVNGEAIVDTPIDAIESFAFMDIDFLALGDFWISKADNPRLLEVASHDDYLAIRRRRYATRVDDSLSKLDLRKYEPWYYPTAAAVRAFAAWPLDEVKAQ